jgi:Tfp pilus assembly protein PilX
MSKIFKLKKLSSDQDGVTMVLVLITGLILASIGLSLANRVIIQFTTTSADVYDTNALMVAEAGVEQSMDQLNASSSFTGYATPQVFFNDTKQGYATYTTTVTAGTGQNQDIIKSVGNIYTNSSATTPVSTRTVEVTAVGTSSSGYSVYGGPGGLILSGSASIVNSEVYSNGYINLSGAASIGTQTKPLTVNVANDQCPTGSNPGSAYPEVCSNGTQPITMSGSAHIYGTVCATGQTSSTGSGTSAITGGSSGSGLEAGCTAPTATMPTYSRSAQIAAVTTTASGTNSTYDCTQYVNGIGFNRTWPANLELTGNVNIASSCVLTITGNVYITGNLTIGGAAQIIVSSSVGTTTPVIIVDGTINAAGSGSVTENSKGTSLEFISFESPASCDDTCTSLSGNNLYTSENTQTVNVGGAGNFPGVIFDAYWGEILLGGSGTMGAAIGQTINLSGAGTITFGTQLASGQPTWTIRSYQLLYH